MLFVCPHCNADILETGYYVDYPVWVTKTYHAFSVVGVTRIYEVADQGIQGDTVENCAPTVRCAKCDDMIHEGALHDALLSNAEGAEQVY